MSLTVIDKDVDLNKVSGGIGLGLEHFWVPQGI